MKLRCQSATAIGILLCFGCCFQSSYAETICESASVRDFLAHLPRGCQKERIEATGALSFGVLRSAENLAWKAWERRVLTHYGEQFLDWRDAACKSVICVHASFARSRRCTVSAFPCAANVDRTALESLNTQQATPVEPRNNEPLTAAEIKEMQQLLSDAGYHVRVDGIFGDRTRRALAGRLRSKGFRDGGSATRENLEILRRMSKA